MINLIFYIFIIYYIFKIVYNTAKNTSSTLATTFIKNNFASVSIPYKDANITLYLGDKTGENFIFAVPNKLYSFTTQDLVTLYEKGEKLHIHNKILITDFPIDTSLSRKISEYDIEVWNSAKINHMNSSSSDSDIIDYNSSALKTSNTSDDTCDIDENLEDPIQDGTLHTHGIFSIFNKVDHL